MSDTLNSGRCVNCGYSLDGLPSPVAACRKCGWANPAWDPPRMPLAYDVAAVAWLPAVFIWHFATFLLFPLDVLRPVIVLLIISAWPLSVLTLFALFVARYSHSTPVLERRTYHTVGQLLMAAVVGTVVFFLSVFAGCSVTKPNFGNGTILGF